LREEGYEGEKVDDFARGQKLAAVNIDGVAHRLKRVERDAYG
jgi:hypothetical protein